MDINQSKIDIIDKEKRDKELTKLFQEARDVLEKLDANIKREKKQIVVQLAKSLEGLIQIDTICIEIVTQLRGQVSERFIRECLDERYKQKIRIQNARKQKRKNQLNDKEDFELAELTPLSYENDNSKISLIETNNPALLQRDGNNIQNACSVMNSAIASSNTYRLSINSSNQGPTKEYSKYEKCKRCNELLIDNFQLQEALKKTKLFTNAIDMKKSNEDKILEFEICIPKDAIIKFIDSILDQDSGDNIWITGRFDVNTGRASYSNCGKMQNMPTTFLK